MNYKKCSAMYCVVIIFFVTIICCAVFNPKISNTKQHEENTTDRERISVYDGITEEQTSEYISEISSKVVVAQTTTHHVVYQKETTTAECKINTTDYEDDLLLRLGMCEAGGESTECIAHVMQVVLNRVESDNFPNSVESVIYQNGQFSPVSTGWFDNISPSYKCYDALEMVKNGEIGNNALFFESCNGDSWASYARDFDFECCGIRFYR